MSAGFVAVPVVPTFKGMSKEFSQRLEKPAQESGKRASEAISKGLGSAVDNLERQVKASSTKLNELDRAYETSVGKRAAQQEKLEAVTLRLQDAEEKYQKALEKGGKGTAELAKVKEAKARVIGETEKLEQAEIDVRVAEEKHKNQLEDLQSTLSRYDQAQDQLADQLGVTRSELSKMGGEFSKLDTAMDDSSNKAEGWGSRFAGILKPLGKLGGLAVGLAGINSVAGTLQAGFDKVTSIEDTTASLGILMGSAEEATKVMGQLQESNQGTPYSFDAWADAGKNLIAFGVDAGKVSDIVTGLGEAASASGKGEDALNSMAGAFGKAAASGKISMDTINSLAEGGVQGLAIMANEYGVTTEEMQKKISSGAVEASEGIDILTKGILEGSSGIAGEVASMSGVMGEMAETTSGRLTNMKAAFNNAAKSALEELNPLIGDAAKHITDWTYAGIDLFKTHMVPAIHDGVDAAKSIMEKIKPALETTRDVLKTVVEWLKSSAEWLLKNKDWVSSLAVSVGVLVGAYKMWAQYQKIMAAGGFLKWIAKAVKATKVWTAVTKAQAMAQRVLNTVMKANPIGLIITAITAVVPGLAWFFTQTEIGRELWQKFTDALGAGWDWVVEKFQAGLEWIKEKWDVFSSAIQSAWESYIKPVFDAILQVAKVTIGVLGTLILAPLLIAWNVLSAGIKAAWETIIKPVWDAIVDFAQNTLWPILQGVFGFIKSAWQVMADAMGAVWAWLRDNIFTPFMDGLSALGDWFKARIDDMVAAWQWYQDLVHAGWQFIDNYVFAPLRAGLKVVADWFRARVDDMLAIWQGFQNVLKAGWEFVNQYVFQPFKGVLETMQGWFRTTVDNIGKIWDGIKEKTKKPVQFVVDVVYNNGIRKAWNAVAGLVGLDKLQEIKFATGGILPGYTPGRDPYTFVEPRTGMRIGLSGGEAIVRPEVTRVLGSAWVDGVNAAARVGGEAGVADFLYGDREKRNLGGFYSGGVIGSITDWVHKYYPMMTITSTLRNTNDYHGQGLAVDFSNGTDTTPQMQSAAQNLFSNYGKGLLELIHSPFNHNVKHGKDVGDGFGFYGAGTMNQHRNHVHVASQQPLGDPKNMVEMVWDGAKAVFTSIKDRVSGLFNPIIDAVKGKIDSFSAPGIIGGLPSAMFKTLWGAAKDFLMGKADEASSYSGAAGSAGNAESWREMAMAAMRRQGFNADDPAQVNAMLSQIMSESGGNPGIAQQIVDINGTGDSAGVGLLQIIPGTFAAHRDPELPDDRRDPWSNMNAALRYYKSRYGTDLTTMWGHGHGYASGGVVELPKLYDQGGWLPHGGFAQNLSGKPEPVFTASQWSSLSDMIRTLGDLVPAIKGQTDVIARAVDGAQAWLAKAGDYNSIEGINARQGVRRVLDLGLDLPGSDIIKTVLDGEDALWDSRARAAKNLDTIVEKEKALEEARKAVADLNDKPEGVSEGDQKKIDEAQKKLDEAKADKAKADSDDARAKAADKVTEAEKKLKDVREEVDKNSEENSKKHAEEVTKANEAVAKAEGELAAARKQQAMDLDNVVLLSQRQIKGLIPQAEALASKLIGMGAPAQAVNAGLGMVVGKLASIAGLAGPAGLTLGMAMDMLKVGISIIKSIVEAIVELVNRIRKARLEALKALAEGWAVIADYANLVVELQGRVTSLQQELVRGANAQREAEYNLMLAQHDRYIAEAEGALKVAEARLALDAEIKRGATIAQLKMMGLHEDWDSYMAYQALEAQGVLQEWSDSAISALFSYEKARAEALKGEVTARLEQIKAEAALAEAQRQNVRNQQDLLVAQERLIKMSAKVAGVDLVEATGTAQVAKLMAEMAEVKQAMDKNVLGRWGVGLGANGSYANEYRGQQAKLQSLQNALDAVVKETGTSINRGDLDRTLKLMARAAARGGDPTAVLRAQMPQLADAETALRVNEALKPIYDARDQQTDLARQVEDFTAEIGLYEKTSPLERTLKGLDYTIQSLEQASAAFADGNEKLRGEYLAAARANHAAAQSAGVDWKLDSKYATPGVRDQIRRETTIYLDGEKMYTADQIDQLLDEVTAGTNGTYRIVRSASEVAVSRRKERV
ncbi:tape measure protein [Corynebacterium striatum]